MKKKAGAEKLNNTDRDRNEKKKKGLARFLPDPADYISESAARLLTTYDFVTILLVTGLVLFGVVMVFSAGYYSTTNLSKPDPYYFLKKEGEFAIMGFIIMFLMARWDYHKCAKYYKQYLYISIFLLILVLTPVGRNVNGATRWIYIGPVNITPSEITKVAMIIFTAAFLAKDPSRATDFSKGILPLLALTGIQAAMIIKQPNLSTAMVIVFIVVGMLIIGGFPWKYVGGVVAAGVAGIIFILVFLPNSHWYSRLTNFIDPFENSQGEGYQVSQSLIALGNGGLKGLGLGNSVTKNLYLPEPQNDFILAIIGEELGFVGIFLLMLAYLFLIKRCFVIAAKAPDKLGMFLASGVGIMLGVQVLMNIAVVTASMPATGVTLPFVSYGGTSIIVFMAAMGIVLNISRKEDLK